MAQARESSDNDRICSVCANIDLQKLMQTPAESFEEHGSELTSWPTSLEYIAKRECMLCQLFASVGNKYKRDFEQQLLVSRGFSAKQEADSPVQFAITRSRTTRGNKIKNYKDIKDEIGECGLIVMQSPNEGFVKNVDCNNIDFEMIGSWLSACQSQHDNCENQINLEEQLRELKLIDCEEECIATIPALDARYLALSYVWGDKIENDRDIDSRLESDTGLGKVPKTIADAIIVTRKLGLRCLWNDQKCIDPNASDLERAHLIRNMNVIYGHAYATIVALHGNDDEAGLPGVSDVPRLEHMSVRRDGMELISTLPNARRAIRKSYWNTRGWTYQEAKLSKRCLFFSEHQLYFVCRSACCSEALPSGLSPISNTINRFRLRAPLFMDNLRGDFLLLDRSVYSARTLTKDGDGLNAFRGILSRSKWSSLWGVTITVAGSELNCYDGFALGLTWTRSVEWFDHQNELIKPEYPPSEFGVREEFPSWSWTSIKGPIFFFGGPTETIYYSYITERSCRTPENRSRLHVWMVDETNEWVPLDDCLRRRGSNALVEMSTCLLVEGDVVQVWNQGGAKKNPQTWFFKGHEENVSKTTNWEPDSTTEQDCQSPHSALILVNWHDSQPESERRFVLMVLEKVKDGTFKRKGLLSKYDSTDNLRWQKNDINKISMMRERFYLV